MSEQPKAVDHWGRDEEGFTIKERLFIQEYPVDWNAAAAARRAGYSHKTAANIASELKHKPKIIDAITRLLAKRAEKTAIDAGWVLARLVAVELEAAEAAKSGKAGNAPRLHRLKALELIGKHVDVNAFRTQLGFSPQEGSERLWDLSRLDDEELDTFERLLAKISVAGPSGGNAPGGEAGPNDAPGPGAAGDVEGSDPS